MPDIVPYIEEIGAAMGSCQESVRDLQRVVLAAKFANRRVWCLGNGGSLAIAQHFAQDLVKLAGVRAHTINCPSMLMAYSNDDGFEYSFFNPFRLMSEEGEPVIIFSCSGKSRNYIEFVSGFSDGGARRNPVIAVIGTDGGFLLQKADLAVHIKSDDYQVCETAFCIVADLVVKAARENKGE